MRQSLSAVLGQSADAVPAGLDELVIGLLEAFRRRHFAVGKLRALLVALAVEGIEHFLREFPRLPQYRVHQLGVDLGVTG